MATANLNLPTLASSNTVSAFPAVFNDAVGKIDAADLTQRGTLIPDNADLDTYMTPGKYYCLNAASAATLSNTPVTGSGFSLYVLKQGAAAANYRLQIITANSTAMGAYTPFYRSRLGNNWLPWFHLTPDERVCNKFTATGTTSSNGNLSFTLPKKGVVTAAWTASNAQMCTVFPDTGADANGSTKWYVHVASSTSGAVVASTSVTVYVLYTLM